jgi:mono/diheme cytochrome c family protein
MRKKIILAVFLIFATGILFAFFPFSKANVIASTNHTVSENLAPPYQVQPGQALFNQKCSTCHTIGGGQLVGPDLKGVTERRQMTWLIDWIVAPDKMVDSGDPIAKELVQEYGTVMPTLGITEAQAKEILSYIELRSSDQTSPEPKTPNVTPAPTVVGKPETGKYLFTGNTPLKNGAAACISCHSINGIGFFGGGTVGKNLTQSYATLGEPGLTSILKSPPFPMMRENFANRPLIDGEIADLIAFLRDSGAGGAESSNSVVFVAIGVGGALLFIGIFALYWKKRLSGVRQSLLKGALK